MTALPLESLGVDEAGVSPRARPRVAMRLTWPLVAVAALAVVSRLVFVVRPFESDAGLYAYMGKVVALGKQAVYRDFYETKLPGVPLLMAGLWRVLGDRWAGYVLLQAAMAVGGAVLLSRAARRAFGPAAGVPALLFGVTLLNFSPAVFRGFQLETVQTFCACVAGYFAVRALGDGGKNPTPRGSAWERIVEGGLRWDVFLLGVFAGVAAMVKPTAGAVAAAYVITLIATRRAWVGRSAVAFAGAMVAPAAVAIWTWRAGLWPEMPGLWREISLYGAQSTFAAEDWFKPLVAGLIIGFPFGVAWVFRRDAERGASGHVAQARPLNVPVSFAAVWFVIECVGVVIQGRMYGYHMLPLAAPLALLFAAACAGGRRPAALVAALAPLVLVSLFANGAEFRMLWEHGPRRLALSDWLRARAAPGDAVAGDGIERLLMETGLRCGTRYAHLFYLANHDDAPGEFGRRYVEDLERNRPAWAVFRADRVAHVERQVAELPLYARRPVRGEGLRAAWRAIDAHVASHYEAVAEVEGVTVYKRRLRSVPSP